MHGITSPQLLPTSLGVEAKPPISRRELKQIMLEQAKVDAYEREGGKRLMSLDHHAVIREVGARGFSVRPWDVLTLQNELIDRCWGRQRSSVSTGELGLEKRARGDTHKAIVALHKILNTTPVSAPGDAKPGILDDVADPSSKSAAFEAVRFDFTSSKLKPKIGKKELDHLEIRIGSMSKSLMIIGHTTSGKTLAGAVPSDMVSKTMSENKELFAALLKLGKSFPGSQFEHDKSKAFHDTKTFTDKDWDKEMTTEDTRDVYGAKVYPAIADAIDHLIDRGALPKDPVILDVGCGRGELSCMLSKMLPKAKLFGGEYNQPSLEAALESGSQMANKPKFFHLDAINGLTETAKKQGVHPDVIVMSGFIAKVVLEPEQGKKVMQQVFDLLPPGGLVVMAQKTDNLFSAHDFKALGFEVANTWSPRFDRCCYVLRKPLDS